MRHFEREILEVLAATVDATRQNIMDKTKFSLATFGPYTVELKELDYITATKNGSKHVCRYSITERGMNALERERRADRSGQVVRAMTIDKLSGVYVPPAWMTRNNGNREIRSLGAFQ